MITCTDCKQLKPRHAKRCGRCKDCQKKYAANWAATWARNNPSLKKEKREQWNKANPEKVGAWWAKRHAMQLKATPKWVDKDEEFLIQEIYSLARLRTKVTKIKWEVDHIIPLKSELVCGLHTVENLQVITQKQNRQKYNKYVP